MPDQRVYLKIKLKSLIAEARYIRREERKRLSGKACHRLRHPDPRRHPVEADAQAATPACPHPNGDHTPAEPYVGLYLHRVKVLRPETRHTLLAYGFIRGRTYNQMETISADKLKAGSSQRPNWDQVLRMVQRYFSSKVTVDLLEKWADAGDIPGVIEF